MENVCAVVLAAGGDERMKSGRPAAMMNVLGKPMAAWTLDCLLAAGINDICMVTGFCRELAEGAFCGGAVFTYQAGEDEGEGGMLARAADFLRERRGGHALVLGCDRPLISPGSVAAMAKAHTGGGRGLTVMTAALPVGAGLMPIARGADGEFLGFADGGEGDLREASAGAYLFSTDALLAALDGLDKRCGAGDIAQRVLRDGARADTYEVPVREAIPARDRAELMTVNEEARVRVMARHLANGVGICCPDGIIIGPDVTIGRDTEILPGSIIRGRCAIGEGCTIGPNALLEDAVLGDGVSFNASQAYDSEIGAGARVGPFAHLRPGCRIGERAKIGNFNELKNAHLGEKTSVAHLSYVGDARIGAGVNLGCGVVTVNYDGRKKHITTVEDGAFVGCNTNMVAPVKIGRESYVAAGSTITQDVPPGALAVARERQRNIEGWVERRNARLDGK